MKTGKTLLYLSRADLETIAFPMCDCMDVLEEAHKALASGRVEMPSKPYIGDPLGEGFLSAYAAKIQTPPQVGVKWLGGCAGNKAKNLPTFHALIILNDPVTLCPIAVMDGTYITGLRTAGVSGATMRHFANKDSRTVAILGCGLQGRMHLRATMAACDGIRRAYVWGPSPATARRFMDEMKREFELTWILAEQPEEAVREADIVISSTPIGPPEAFSVLKGEWFRPGVTAISISRANHFTADGFAAFDRYIVDELPTLSLVAERPGFAHCAQIQATELGAFLLTGEGGRESREERILCVCDGIAVNDIAVGTALLHRAMERGIGTELPL